MAAKVLACAKRLAVVTAGFGMGLLNVAEKAEDESLEEVFEDGDCDDLDPGDDPVVGLVLILPLLPCCKVLPGVKDGMIGVLLDGFKLDLLLLLTTLLDVGTCSPALVRGFFLNCLRSLTIEEDFLLLLVKPFGLVGDDNVFDVGDGNFGEAA